MVGEVAYGKLKETGLKLPKPEGGFYLFPDASELAESLADRGIKDSTTLCEQLLQESGVAVLPGSDFGRPDSELSFRLATVNFDGAEALKQVARFEGDSWEFVETHCFELWDALDALCSWLKR